MVERDSVGPYRLKDLFPYKGREGLGNVSPFPTPSLPPLPPPHECCPYSPGTIDKRERGGEEGEEERENVALCIMNVGELETIVYGVH